MRARHPIEGGREVPAAGRALMQVNEGMGLIS